MVNVRMRASSKETNCLFCEIANGSAPAHSVYEDDHLFAFLDVGPIRPGHIQITPRAHYTCFEELPPELAAEVIHLGQRLAIVLKKIYEVPRVGFLFTGGDIAHAHAHVIPLVKKTDITSRRYIVEEKITFRNTPRPTDHEMKETAEMIRARFQVMNKNVIQA